MGTTQALAVREEAPQSTALARSNQISDVQRLGGLLAASGYFSDAREMAQAAVKVMAGEELGIPPVAAMMGINIIKGKIALGGNLIASRIRAHGYDFIHKQFDATGCVLIFLGRKGDDDRGHGMLAGRPILGESSFNEADAKAAQIGSDMYKKFPRNMYFNRSISNGAKWYTPEVFAGAPVYVPEELGATVDEQGDMVHPEPTRAEQVAAQAAVLNRKLAEVGKQKQTKAQPAPAAPPVEYVEDLGEPPALDGPPEVSTARRILSEQEFRAAGKRGQIEAFGLMKEALGDPDYYRILGVCGATHANEFAKLGEAVKAYNEMVETYRFAANQRSI